MRRLLRRIFSFAAAVSAVLLVGVCVLWVRSCDRSDYVTVAGAGGRLWWFESGYGGLSVTAVRRWPRCEPWAWRSVAMGVPAVVLVVGDSGLGTPQPLIPYAASRRGACGVWVSREAYTSLIGADGGPVLWPAGFWPPGSSGQPAMSAPLPGVSVAASFPMLAALFAFPIWRLAARSLYRMGRRVMEDRRRQRGLCPACGYDLTANTSGRCSECSEEVLKDGSVKT